MFRSQLMGVALVNICALLLGVWLFREPDAPFESRQFAPRFFAEEAFAPCKRRSRQVDRVPDLRCLQAGIPGAFPRGAIRALRSASISDEIQQIEIEYGSRPKDADVAGKLGAWYLVRGGVDNDPRDIVIGLEFTLAALEKQPGASWLQVNLALALDSLGMSEQAVEAWRRVLIADAETPWVFEAERELRKLASLRGGRKPIFRPKFLDGNEKQLALAASFSIVELRKSGQSVTLQQFVSACLQGDVESAREASAEGMRLGKTIVALGGDSWLSDLFTSSASNCASAPLGSLESWLEGLSHYEEERFSAARESFDAVVLDGKNSPIYVAAAVYSSCALDGEQKLALAQRRLEDLGGYPDVGRYSVWRGYRSWMQGLLALRTGRPLEASRHYRAAMDGFDEAGELENFDTVSVLLAQVLERLGRHREAWHLLHRSLLSADTRPARQRYVARLVAVRALEKARLWRAAVRFQDGVVAAANMAQGSLPSEALLLRASLKAGAKDIEGALEDLDAARIAASAHGSQMSDADRVSHAGLVHAEVLAMLGRLSVARPGDLRILQATRRVELEPKPKAWERIGTGARRSTILIESARQYFEQQSLWLRWLDLAADHVRALSRAGQIQEAEDVAGIALLHVASSLKETTSSMTRAAYAGPTRRLFDELISVRWQQNNPIGALVALDDFRRRSFSSTLSAEQIDLPLPMSLPAGVGVLIFGVTERRVLRWWLADGESEAKELSIDPELLAQTVVALRLAIAANDGERVANLGLTLGSWLLDGIESRILGAQQLVVIPDRSLFGLPFSMLAVAGGSQLIDQVSLVLSPSLKELDGESRFARATAGQSILAIGDPAFNAELFAGLDRLPSAAGEAQSVAAFYADSKLLLGDAATRSSILDAIGEHDIFHLAGHSTDDRFEPMASVLFLAPDLDNDGTLYARDVAALDLAGVQLAVLSACDSGNSFDAQTEALSGLTRAFMIAGVPQVVGSLWPVDDAATGELFFLFHRHVVAGADAAQALRWSQLALRDKGAPAKHWASFQIFAADIP